MHAMKDIEMQRTMIHAFIPDSGRATYCVFRRPPMTEHRSPCLNDESTSTALHALIDRLTELHKVGAIDTLCDTLMMVHALRNALTDNMVERLFTFFEQMINTVGNEAMGELAQNTRVAFEAAVEETAQTAPRGGQLAMLAMLSKPEAQRSLAFLLAFGEKLQRGAAGA